jgi:hypothetical protein
MRKKKTAPAAGDVGDRKKISGEINIFGRNATTLQSDRLVVPAREPAITAWAPGPNFARQSPVFKRDGRARHE